MGGWNRLNLEGIRFGRLLVIGQATNRGKKRMWPCQCDCGKTLSVRTSCLSTLRQSSCGCLTAESVAESNRRRGVSRTENGQRTCYICLERKPIGEFVNSKSTADGKEYFCRGCVNSRRGKAERSAARAVKSALRSGRLVRQPCEQCGNHKSEGHHDDYAQPLSVRWLCRAHHAQWHSKNQPMNGTAKPTVTL